MTINSIINNQDLFPIVRFDVSENGVGISFSDHLLDKNGDLLTDRVCILKLDDYHAYNSKSTTNPPKVIDNIVIVQCFDNSIKIYLIELRSSNGRRPTQRLKHVEIEDKFKTAINDFVETRHAEIFGRVKINEAKAFLVTDPWKLSQKADGRELFNKKIKQSALDAYSSRKPLNIFGKKIFINPIMPPDPTITSC